MERILIHQTKDLSEVSGLSEKIEEIKSLAEVEISTGHVPAVAGELAGTAMEVLVSHPVQAFLNAAALGALLWSVIDLLRNAGKKLLISKDTAVPLIANKTLEGLGSNYNGGSDTIRIWGPMEAEITDGPAVNCIEEYEEALGPMGYFMAVAVSRPNNRVKTTYYLLGAGGKLCGSWTTQTYSERVPDFLRPSAS